MKRRKKKEEVINAGVRRVDREDEVYCEEELRAGEVEDVGEEDKVSCRKDSKAGELEEKAEKNGRKKGKRNQEEMDRVAGCEDSAQGADRETKAVHIQLRDVCHEVRLEPDDEVIKGPTVSGPIVLPTEGHLGPRKSSRLQG